MHMLSGHHFKYSCMEIFRDLDTISVTVALPSAHQPMQLSAVCCKLAGKCCTRHSLPERQAGSMRCSHALCKGLAHLTAELS